jgi:hypothetical protein
MGYVIHTDNITEFQTSFLLLSHAVRCQVGILLESVDLHNVAC